MRHRAKIRLVAFSAIFMAMPSFARDFCLNNSCTIKADLAEIDRAFREANKKASPDAKASSDKEVMPATQTASTDTKKQE